MLEIILLFATVSFLLIISGFFITLKQYKEIKNIKTILTTKRKWENYIRKLNPYAIRP